MARIFPRLILLPAAVLGLVAGGALAAAPGLRAIVSAVAHNPERLASLPGSPNIHYEAGGEAFARRVAVLLPGAMAKVEAAQGKPFRYPVSLGVFVTPAAYAAANGLGTPGVAGVTFGERITLSPILFTSHPERLEAVLTHELSHAHLGQWLPLAVELRLPNWFREGLAVLASDGGGAEGISEDDLRAALAKGDRIALPAQGSLLNLTAVRFENPASEPANNAARAHLAYRQAGAFVGYLRRSDPAAFAAMLGEIYAERPFAASLADGYGQSIEALWRDFAKTI